STPVEISSQAAQDYGWYCSTCHGVNGEGSPTVMNSALVGMPIDKDALFTLLTTLPAFGEVAVHTYRGGYPELDDDQLKSLIDYVAVLSGTAETPQAPEATPIVEVTPEVEANTQPIDVAQGQADYGWYCSTCHGVNGEGSPTVLNSALLGMPIDQKPYSPFLPLYPPLEKSLFIPIVGDTQNWMMTNSVIYSAMWLVWWVNNVIGYCGGIFSPLIVILQNHRTKFIEYVSNRR
ncbi:MAG TPA: c-type cytochrome, partial [Aggregatilineales bacterium]|nr:c-type cytochrome [Aggregatilineales bacterium]